jgi:DNA invertase Pin-like site-specific DNA recombinase
MEDARSGQISRIIVKKYDRFSRNLRDYLNVTDELDKYGVSVISLCEPFNTETKEGRMMRNNLLNFAEFERETIASRVADAYNTKSRETGFYMGGVMMFGYAPERKNINGKVGSVLIPSEQSDAVKLAYAMYQNPSCSLRDIIKYFRENDVVYMRTDKYGGNHAGKLNIASLSTMLSNPVYVRADKDVYAYFMSKGYEILDEPQAYDGVHGVFKHEKSDGTFYVKTAYHEGLVDSETWLAVQDKKAHNICFSSNKKPKNSWLVGLVKCAECGHAVVIDKHKKKKSGKEYRYLIDHGWETIESCAARSYSQRIDALENTVFQAMCDRIESMIIAKQSKTAPDADTEAVKAEIMRLDDEIHQLMDKLAYADSIVFSYIQERIKEFHGKKSELERKLQSKARKQKSIDTTPLQEPLNRWESLTVQEKHELAATMIDVIIISHFSDEIEIRFGI